MTRDWPAPAKLNLFLHVLGRRDDGYHRLQTVFQFLDLHDTLRFTPRDDGEIRRLHGPADIDVESDLTVRAARLLQRHGNGRHGVDIALDKRIPMGAGLGGGSSDAATALVALNTLWGLNLHVDTLAALGLSLGADVPVFVRGHAAWGEGVGEVLTPVTLPEPWYAVVVPPVHVATSLIFSAPELRRDHPPIDLPAFLQGAGDNDCTPVTCARYPLVAAALRQLSQHTPARMSGTGAAVFATFDREASAQAALSGLPQDWHGFVARGCNRSPLFTTQSP
jgi:4-diphosphocytidyl-2-C-methyl-D-erythritol kinase